MGGLGGCGGLCPAPPPVAMPLGMVWYGGARAGTGKVHRGRNPFEYAVASFCFDRQHSRHYTSQVNHSCRGAIKYLRSAATSHSGPDKTMFHLWATLPAHVHTTTSRSPSTGS